MKTLRVLVLTHPDLVPPDSLEGYSDKEVASWKTEYDVSVTLQHLGHEASAIGVADDLAPIRRRITDWKPHIVFNLLEEFRGRGVYVPFVLGFLELIRQPFTGCNPSALIVADNKPLMKKILRYHRIPSPDFALFPRGKAIRRSKRLSYPLIVKSSTEHGSVGISQASIVHEDKSLRERIEFVHDSLRTGAMVEEYVDGRELYLGVIGNHRLKTLPIWEMQFKGLSDGAPRIATEKMKWDLAYQEKIGLKTRAANDLSPEVEQRIRKLAKRVYGILGLSGYARMDFRLTNDGKVVLLEPNPNPDLAHDEDFSESAHSIGLEHDKLIHRILNLGLRYHSGGER